MNSSHLKRETSKASIFGFGFERGAEMTHANPTDTNGNDNSQNATFKLAHVTQHKQRKVKKNYNKI